MYTCEYLMSWNDFVLLWKHCVKNFSQMCCCKNVISCLNIFLLTFIIMWNVLHCCCYNTLYNCEYLVSCCNLMDCVVTNCIAMWIVLFGVGEEVRRTGLRIASKNTVALCWTLELIKVSNTCHLSGKLYLTIYYHLSLCWTIIATLQILQT